MGKFYTKSPAKIILIEPPAVQLIRDGEPLNPLVLSYPKYQLLLLASCIENSCNVEVAIIDLKGNRLTKHLIKHTESMPINYEDGFIALKEVGLKIEAFSNLLSDSTVIALSATYTMERRLVLELIPKLRKLAPQALIVIGGHDATVAPTPYLEAGTDLCVIGDGETVFSEIISARSMDELRSIKGIAYIRNGHLIRNGRRTRTKLDDIIFPSTKLLVKHGYDEYPDGPWPKGVGPSFAVLETSRGCDEGCSFCSSTFVAGKFRAFDLKAIRTQLNNVRNAGIKTLLFPDDNILYRTKIKHGGTQGKHELIAFFNDIRADGYCWTFYNGIQFGLLQNENGLDNELIKSLFSGCMRDEQYQGCFEAYIPLERFSEHETVPEFKKLPAAQTTSAIIKQIAQTGVNRLNLGFIIGRPDDTISTMNRYFDEASMLGESIKEASGGITKPYYLPWCSVPLPNTPDRKRYSDRIMYDLDTHPELHNNYVSVLNGINITPGDFTDMRRYLDKTLNNLRSPSICTSTNNPLNTQNLFTNFAYQRRSRAVK